MLEKVGFKNFLALRDVEIDLEPFTVIVGPNSSGKSTILEGIWRISRMRYDEQFFLTRFMDDGSARFEPNFYLNKSALLPNSEVKFSYKNNDSPMSLYDYGRGWWSNDSPRTTLTPPPEAKILKFSASEAARSSYSESLAPTLETSGQGLATICSYLQDPNPDAFAWVQKSLTAIIPNLKRFRMRPARVPALYWFNLNLHDKMTRISQRLEGTGHELIFDFTNAEGIPASQVSEGTLFALTVLIIAASSSGDTVLLIDDLECGLHPKAVHDLMIALREIQTMTPGLQIVATSHSPYVLHSLKPKEVRVTTLDPERGTLVAPLEAYPEFDKWRDAMTPGEFWSFVGEDWVKDLPPLEKASV